LIDEDFEDGDAEMNVVNEIERVNNKEEEDRGICNKCDIKGGLLKRVVTAVSSSIIKSIYLSNGEIDIKKMKELPAFVVGVMALGLIGFLWSKLIINLALDNNDDDVKVLTSFGLFDCCGFETLNLISTGSSKTALSQNVKEKPRKKRENGRQDVTRNGLNIFADSPWKDVQDHVIILDQKVEVYLPTTICPTPKEECEVCASLGCFVASEREI